MSKEKIVVYWCPECQKEVVRHLMIARDPYESVCEQTGKTVKMKRQRWRRANKEDVARQALLDGAFL
jgi:hypothetical protein